MVLQFFLLSVVFNSNIVITIIILAVKKREIIKSYFLFDFFIRELLVIIFLIFDHVVCMRIFRERLSIFTNYLLLLMLVNLGTYSYIKDILGASKIR